MAEQPTIGDAKKNMQKFPSGRLDKFMLIPLMEEWTTWVPAGPIQIGVEGRAIGTREGEIINRGPSVHVVDADKNLEWIRFDCFDKGPHYHYILQADQHNLNWGFDTATNGDLYPWVIAMLGTRLDTMLQKAGAGELAAKLGKKGLADAVLTKIRVEMDAAYQRTFPGTDMIEPGIAQATWWKEVHPQFNTFDQ